MGLPKGRKGLIVLRPPFPRGEHGFVKAKKKNLLA